MEATAEEALWPIEFVLLVSEFRRKRDRASIQGFGSEIRMGKGTERESGGNTKKKIGSF